MPFHSLQQKCRGMALPLLSVLICLGGASSSIALAEDRAESGAMIHQLRIYEIFEDNKTAFHERFRDHAARIMEKHDFDIIAMWESSSAGRTEFVYLLQWPNEAVMRDSWEQFMADQEWSEIKTRTAASHGEMVGAIEDRVMRPTDYSSQL